MPTLRECLSSLPSDMVMRNLAAVRNEVASVSQHLDLLSHDEDGYEVREERRGYGKLSFKVIGIIGGLTVFRQI